MRFRLLFPDSVSVFISALPSAEAERERENMREKGTREICHFRGESTKENQSKREQ